MLRNYVMFTQCDNSKHTILLRCPSLWTVVERNRLVFVTEQIHVLIVSDTYYNIFIEPSTNRVLSWFSEHILTDTKIVYFLNNRSVFAVVVKYDTN
jgi:hypothetical protein